MIEFHPDKRSSQLEIMDDLQLHGDELNRIRIALTYMPTGRPSVAIR